MPQKPNRRDFLKISALSIAALAFRPGQGTASIPPENPSMPPMAGRVTRRSIFAYAEPDVNSRRLHKFSRDAILHLHAEVTSPYEPRTNPRWYRLGSGYVHSAHIQRVEAAHRNEPLRHLPKDGLLGEVTVPYTQAIYHTRDSTWKPVYRLYFRSTHWITGLAISPGGEPWYRLRDERLWINYYVPAIDLRPIDPDEFSPLSSGVPPQGRRIEVFLADQRLAAYEWDRQVLEAPVSTGRRYMDTPSGAFQVNRKCPSKHMGNGGLTADPNAYELVGVPWTCFFHTNGVAFHGTYWHDDFGNPTSHGCVNMRNEDALWLYRWCAPTYDSKAGYWTGRKLVGEGTQVNVV